ncbi:hypothetical protein CIB95_11415 [Lottiidibacillus patelloidae]|uniref:TATA-box binding protein n=1 Tax=Lottiidibacillus patelloidae TaxID=2670334 RepID=A0A263BSN3_9BACI|nr:YwmB family TATA-box binding protein [Lottiidibacillus patelloidae]OZM56377.1 hypothetical protein CIB95_11415 [Lottiidibacillus patelloidae]
MKQLAIVSFISIFGMFFSLHTFGEHSQTEVTQTATEIIEVMNQGDIEVDGWTLYARENAQKLHSEKEMQAWIAQKKEMLQSFTWTQLVKDSNGFKITATKETSVIEKVTFIMYGQKEMFSTYIIYEVTGTKWNENIAEKVNEKINVRSMQLFEEFPVIFTCIKGNAGDRMMESLDDEARKLLVDLDAKTVESLTEEHFVSYSAYSNRFDTSISTDNTAMNVQLALRNEGMGGKTTVIIGTPIITIEY